MYFVRNDTCVERLISILNIMQHVQECLPALLASPFPRHGVNQLFEVLNRQIFMRRPLRSSGFFSSICDQIVAKFLPSVSSLTGFPSSQAALVRCVTLYGVEFVKSAEDASGLYGANGCASLRRLLFRPARRHQLHVTSHS